MVSSKSLVAPTLSILKLSFEFFGPDTFFYAATLSFNHLEVSFWGRGHFSARFGAMCYDVLPRILRT